MRGPGAPILIAVLVSGCQGGAPSPTIDALPQEFSMSAETAIAGDMASRFVEAMGNEKPHSISVSPATDRSGEALETALKLWGYPVLAKEEQARAKNPTTEVAYGATAFEDIVLVRLSTPEITLTRAYRTNSAGAQPATPLAVTRHR